jgi:parallel beta-helix repeat protein
MSAPMKKLSFLLNVNLLVILVISRIGFTQNILYVDGSVASSGDGKSWAGAFKTIQEAVNAAVTNDEIWVMTGTYLLSSEIQVNKAVGIYGGFAGLETQRSQRDWNTNPTTVDGNNSVRCFHVKANATIDGFTITKGSTCCGDGEGGGIFNNSISLDQLTNITVNNCIFSKNSAVLGGGVANNFASSATITNCKFFDNIASNSGGGIFNNSSSITITNCTFSGNKADNYGGGIYNHNAASPTITNCTFSANSAAKGGGIYNNFNNPSIANCVFFRNEATLQGGGMWNLDSNARITNCTFSLNKANGSKGGGIYNESFSRPTITNCIIWDNEGEIYNVLPASPVVTYCDVKGGYVGVGNINSTPLFVDAATGDFHLTAGSPCIDTGDPASPLDADGTRADMGAFYFNQKPVDQTPPAAPQGLTAIAGDRQIILKWRQNTEADFLRYRIYHGTSPNPITKVDSTNNIADTTKIFTGLTNGTKYYFRIAAVDQSLNESGFSNEVSATPTATDLPPAAPQGLTASAGDRQITLKWQQNTEANFLRYRIYRGTSPNPITKVDSTNSIADTSKTFAGLINGTRYYFRITAVDQNLNESGYSNEVSATPATANVPPAAPQNLAATAGDRQITLTWTANSEADFLRYRIYGGTSPNPTAIVDSVAGSANTPTGTASKTLTGLSNGTTYFYRLTAVDLALNASGFSNEVSATPSATDLPPAPPQNLAATAGVAQITLSWNASTETDFLRYRIYGGTNPNPTAKIDSVEGANNTATTLTNLTVGATYYFRVTAVDQALHASGFSNTVTAKPLADNTAPTLANAVYSEPANLNSEVAVAIAATDASGIKNVWLYHRVAGAATFANRVMARQTDNTFTQSIPAAAVTNRGVEFYVRAEDTYSNVTQTGLHPVRVYCPNGVANPAGQPSGAAASFYRLFSIPLSLDNKSPAMFLTTNSSLGAYDNTKYRWYGLERATQTLREYPNFGNLQLTPDMGFALVTNIKNVKLKTSSGTTVATTAPYNISLPAGWSLIGNPFNFNIPFDSLNARTVLTNADNARIGWTDADDTLTGWINADDCVPLSSSAVVHTVRVSSANVNAVSAFELWSFEGDWQINTRGLEPWKGYAIWLSDAATFSIRPGVAGLNNGTALYSVANNDAENWLLQIIADNGRTSSRFNFAGQYAGATDDEDALDLHHPVRLADGVEVVFTKKNSTSLKADIREPSSNGHTWEFTCRLNPEDEVLSLTFDGVATVPQTFDIFLLEPETATAYNLRANPRLQFATRNLTEKRFQLVAGTKAYLHEQSLQAELHPSSFELLQNFPNPFWSGATSRSAGNPSTQIIYSLPEASHVEVSVYNVRGERVATLVNERQEMGSHTVVWNAEQVGSGVYFIKMRAGRVERIKKCLFVK